MRQPGLLQAILLHYLGASLEGYINTVLFACLIHVFGMAMNGVLAWKYLQSPAKTKWTVTLVCIMMAGLIAPAALYIFNVINIINHAYNYEKVLVTDLRVSISTILVGFPLTWLPAMIYFSYQAYILRNRNKSVAAVLGVMTTASVALLFYLLVPALLIPISQPITLASASIEGLRLLNWYGEVSNSAKIWTSVVLGSEFAVCGILVWTLLRTPKNFDSTASLVNRLMRVVMESMLPPFLGTLAMCIMVLSNKSALSPMRLSSVFPAQFSVHAVLHSLLSRQKILETVSHDKAYLEPTSKASGATGASFGENSTSGGEVGITILTTQDDLNENRTPASQPQPANATTVRVLEDDSYELQGITVQRQTVEESDVEDNDNSWSNQYRPFTNRVPKPRKRVNSRN